MSGEVVKDLDPFGMNFIRQVSDHIRANDLDPVVRYTRQAVIGSHKWRADLAWAQAVQAARFLPSDAYTLTDNGIDDPETITSTSVGYTAGQPRSPGATGVPTRPFSNPDSVRPNVDTYNTRESNTKVGYAATLIGSTAAAEAEMEKTALADARRDNFANTVAHARAWLTRRPDEWEPSELQREINLGSVKLGRERPYGPELTAEQQAANAEAQAAGQPLPNPTNYDIEFNPPVSAGNVADLNATDDWRPTGKVERNWEATRAAAVAKGLVEPEKPKEGVLPTPSATAPRPGTEPTGRIPTLGFSREAVQAAGAVRAENKALIEATGTPAQVKYANRPMTQAAKDKAREAAESTAGVPGLTMNPDIPSNIMPILIAQTVALNDEKDKTGKTYADLLREDKDSDGLIPLIPLDVDIRPITLEEYNQTQIAKGLPEHEVSGAQVRFGYETKNLRDTLVMEMPDGSVLAMDEAKPGALGAGNITERHHPKALIATITEPLKPLTQLGGAAPYYIKQVMDNGLRYAASRNFLNIGDALGVDHEALPDKGFGSIYSETDLKYYLLDHESIGTGYFVGGAARMEQDKLAMDWGTIDGVDAVTLGRGFARGVGMDPGSRAYGITSGTIDGIAVVGLDPSTYLGPGAFTRMLSSVKGRALVLENRLPGRLDLNRRREKYLVTDVAEENKYIQDTTLIAVSMRDEMSRQTARMQADAPKVEEERVIRQGRRYKAVPNLYALFGRTNEALSFRSSLSGISGTFYSGGSSLEEIRRILPGGGNETFDLRTFAKPLDTAKGTISRASDVVTIRYDPGRMLGALHVDDAADARLNKANQSNKVRVDGPRSQIDGNIRSIEVDLPRLSKQLRDGLITRADYDEVMGLIDDLPNRGFTRSKSKNKPVFTTARERPPTDTSPGRPWQATPEGTIIPDLARQLDNDVGSWFDEGVVPELPDEVVNDWLGDQPMAMRERALGVVSEEGEERLVRATNGVPQDHVPGTISAGLRAEEGKGLYGGFDGFEGEVDMHLVPTGTRDAIPDIPHDPRMVGKPARGKAKKTRMRREEGSRLEDVPDLTDWPPIGDPLWDFFRNHAATRGDSNAMELFAEAATIERYATDNYLEATGKRIEDLEEADMALIRAEADEVLKSSFPDFNSAEARAMIGDAMPMRPTTVSDTPKRMEAVSDVVGTYVDPASLPNIVYRVNAGPGSGGRLGSDRGLLVVADEQQALNTAELLRALDDLPSRSSSMKWRNQFIEAVRAQIDDEDLVNEIIDLAKTVTKGQGSEFARQAFRAMRQRGMPVPGNLGEAKFPLKNLHKVRVYGVDKRVLSQTAVTDVGNGMYRVYGRTPFITEAGTDGAFVSASHGVEEVRFADDVDDPTFSMKLAPTKRGWESSISHLTIDEPAARGGARAGWLQGVEDKLYRRGWVQEPLPEQKAVRWHKPGSGEFDRVVLDHVDESERGRYLEFGISEGPVKVVTTERLLNGLQSNAGTRFATDLLDATNTRLVHLAQGKMKVHVVSQIKAVQERYAAAVEEGVEGARDKAINDVKEVLLVNSAELDPGLRALRSPFTGKYLDNIKDKPNRFDILHKAPRLLAAFNSAMPANYVQIHDPDEALKQMQRWTTMLKFSDADTERLLGMAIDAVTNKGRYSAFEELMRVSNDAVQTSMMKHDSQAKKLIKEIDSAEPGSFNRAGLQKRLDRRIGYHELFANSMTRMFADGMNAERTVLSQMIADGVDTSLNSVTYGGKTYMAPPTHVLSEMIENVVPMPDPRNLRRANTRMVKLIRRMDTDEADEFFKKHRAVDTINLFETLGAFYTTKIWKPTTLLRVGYLVRNMIDEQARMWASGAINPFSHPIDYWLTAMKTGRYDRTFTGQRIGLNKDGSRVLETDPDNFAYNSMLSNGGVLADPLAAAKKQHKAGQGVVDITDTVGNTTKIKQYTNGWAQTVTQIHHDNLLRRMVGKQGWTERDLQSLPTQLKDEGTPAEMLHWWIWHTKRGARAWSEIVESSPEFIHLNDIAGSRQLLGTWEKIIDNFVSQDPRLRDAVATGKVLDDEGNLVPLATIKPGGDIAVHPALNDLTGFIHKEAESVGDLTTLPQRVKLWSANKIDKNMVDGWDRFVGWAFSYLNDIPSDNLVRIPMFKAFYYDEALNLIPYMSKVDQAEVIKIAGERGIDKATGRIAAFVDRVGGSRVQVAPKAYVKKMQEVSDASPDIGILTRFEADVIAQRRATEKIRKLLYDTHDKRLIEDSMRIVAPFMSAWRNGLMTWGKLFTNPKVVSRAAAAQRVLSSDESGQAIYGDGHKGRAAMYIDPTTNEPVMNYPANMNYLSGALGKLVGVPGVPTEFARNTTGGVSGLNVFATAAPGFGPVANLGMAGINGAVGSNDIQQWAYDQYTLLNSGIEPTDPVRSFLPAALGKMMMSVTGLGNAQTTRMYQANLTDAATYLLSKDPTASSKPGFVDEVKDLADGMMWNRGFTQFVMPASGQLDARQHVFHNGTASTAVQGELDEIRRDYTAAYGFDEGNQAFLRDFGETGYFVGLRGTRSRGTTNSDAQTFEYLRDNPGLVEEYPNAFGVLVPVPSDGHFSLRAYQLLNRLQATEMRDAKDYGEYAQSMLGGVIYEAEERTIQAALAAGQIDEDEAASIKDAVITNIRDKYPKYNPSFNPGSTIDKIQELEEAAEDPDLKSNPAVRATAEYLTLRREVMAMAGIDEDDPRWTSKASAPYRDQLRQYGEELVQREPAFSRAWDMILSKEVTP